MATAIPSTIEAALTAGDITATLQEILRHFDAQAGTIHWLDSKSGMLTLGAHHNIPPQITALVATVPIGKGIAGLAAERREPIALCNLQTDTSGQARPAAKSTGMEGSLAVPMLLDDQLRGVLGVAKACAYEWSEDEKSQLLGFATRLGALRP